MPERIQRKRVKGWRMPEGAVYVGRPTKWGNPFQVEMRRGFGARVVAPGWLSPWQFSTKEEAVLQAVERYRRFLLLDAEGPARYHGVLRCSVATIRRDLRDKDLACWCSLDEPCHADVLLEIANGDTGEKP